MPANVSVSGKTVTPQIVSAPAFLAIRFGVAGEAGRAHVVAVILPSGPVSIAVPAGGRASVRLPGLRPGSYPISVDGTTTAARLRVTSSSAGGGGA